jgi:thiamine monophosphate synthase
MFGHIGFTFAGPNRNSMTDKIDRCRLVLVTPDIADAAELARLTGDALRGGDVASVIIPQHGSGRERASRSGARPWFR